MAGRLRHAMTPSGARLSKRKRDQIGLRIELREVTKMPFVEFTFAQGHMAQGKIWIRSEAVDAIVEAKINGNSLIVLRGGGQFSLMEKYAEVLKEFDIAPAP